MFIKASEVEAEKSSSTFYEVIKKMKNIYWFISQRTLINNKIYFI